MFVMLSIVMLAEAMPVQLPRIRGTVSVSFPVMHASAMIFGPLAGAWVAAVGSLRPRDLEGQVGWVPLLFNRLQLAASTYAAGSVFQYMSGDLTNYSDPRSIMAVVASGGMYLLLNMTAITIFSSIVDKRSPLRVWWTGLTWALPNTLALLPISYLVATTYQVLNLIAPLFLALPLLVARYSYQRYVDMRNQYIDTIRSLAAALEAKDPRTYGHADRVSQLSMAVGKEMGFTEGKLEQLQVAGILHDVGKIGVSDTILNKAGRFTQEEFREMAKHPEIGARIVENVEMLHEVADWIRYHHERYDGTGYPEGLAGEDIPLESRIIAVADAFDAMTSIRPYKDAMTVEEALAELERCAGTQFDPAVVAAFIKVAQQPEFQQHLIRVEDNLFAANLLKDLDKDSAKEPEKEPANGVSPQKNDQAPVPPAPRYAQEAPATTSRAAEQPGLYGGR